MSSGRVRAAARHAIALLGASHPGPVAAVTATGVGLAASAGGSPVALLRIGSAVLSGQLAVGWQNDFLDADRDRDAHRGDKPIANGVLSRGEVGRAAAIAGALCVPASLLSGRKAGGLHLAAVASAFSYNLKLKATPASFLPYACSFALLPRFAELAVAPHEPPALWPAIAGATLGVAAHLVNVLPDREADRAAGIFGLPQRLSPEVDVAAAGALLGLSSLVVAAGTRTLAPRATATLSLSLGLSAAVIARARKGGRSAFAAVLALALVDVTQLLVATRRRAKRARA